MIAEELKKHGKRNGKWVVTRWIMGVRQRARKKGVEFSLTKEDFTIPDVCPMLGIPLFFSPGKATANTPSIDRIDNTKGYTSDNVRVISWEANRLKSDITLERAERMLDMYTQIVHMLRPRP